MRVLYIVTLFARNDDDVINPWMVETIQRLRGKGLDVDVYAPSYRGLKDHDYRGIAVKRFRYCIKILERLSHERTVPDRIKENKFWLFIVPFYIIGGILGLIRVCRQKKYDLIHVHWPFPHALFGWLAARLCRAALVCQFHGVELRWVEHSLPAFGALLDWSLRISDLVIANSSHTAAAIKKRGVDCRLEVIPYGSPVEFRERAVVERGTKTILFVGRLVERKGIEYLIRALEYLDKSYSLTVVGEGPEEEKLRALTAELGHESRVTFAGRIGGEALAKCYESADCFVLPAITDSRGDTEGLGVVLIEALSCGLPVIASRSGGIVDIVIDNETGLLVPEKDPRALAAAIEKALTDKELAARLVAGGREQMRKNFAWDSIIERLISLYRELQ